jgi:hypothetical protein
MVAYNSEVIFQPAFTHHRGRVSAPSVHSAVSVAEIMVSSPTMEAEFLHLQGLDGRDG